MRTNKFLLVPLFILFCSANAWAITITPGNPGNAGTDNVLFNNAALMHGPGPLVQGNFSSGNDNIVDFTSTSGTGSLVGNGGQAEIDGGPGNNPFTDLSFMLENGVTFTKAILNPDVTVDGTIDFTITFIDPAGMHTAMFPVSGNGNNFFGITADGTEQIVKVTFDLTGTAATDTAQIRIGGFSAGVPDGGSTVALLGLAFVGIATAHKMVSLRASKS